MDTRSGLTPEEEADRQLGLDDLFFFAKQICHLRDLAVDTHKPICDLITRRIVEERKNVGIIIPRDHFKSSIGLAACLWLFTRRAVMHNRRDLRVLIDTATLDLSTKHVRWLGNQMKLNDTYRRFYGDFTDKKKGARVGVKQLTVSGRDGVIHKEPNFVANSIEAEVTGLHFDVIWHDDIISEKNYHTPMHRQKAREHYYSVDDLKDPKGVKLFTATRWHDGDVAGMLLKKNEELQDDGWEFYVRSAILEDGRALFPERWPLDALERKKADITAFHWACTPAETPILMSDFTCKPISEIKPGDEIVGWVEGSGKKNAALTKTKVKSVFTKTGLVNELKMESGRSVFCTEEHKWYTGRHEKSRNLYAPAKVGSVLRFVCEPQRTLTHEEEIDWAYFGGLFDGEGSAPKAGSLNICQSPEKNPDVTASIEAVLSRLKIPTYCYERNAAKGLNPKWSDTKLWIMNRPFQTSIDLMRYSRCAKRGRLEQYVYRQGRKFVKEKDRVSSITPRGWEPVYALETETGNYVAWGYASSNSQWMNDPVLKEFSIPFKTEHMYVNRENFPKHLRAKTVTVDPNFRDEQMASGDYAGMLVGGFDQWMQWWGLDFQMGFWTASQFIDKIFEMNYNWKPQVFKIERKFTSFLEYAIRLKERELGIVLPILWIDRDQRSKETRYSNLEPMFRAGRIRLAYEIDEKTKREIEDELTRCGYSAHDEFLDCLSDQFEQINPIMGTQGEQPTFPGEPKPLEAVIAPSAPMRYTMYGSPEAGLDD